MRGGGKGEGGASIFSQGAIGALPREKKGRAGGSGGERGAGERTRGAGGREEGGAEGESVPFSRVAIRAPSRVKRKGRAGEGGEGSGGGRGAGGREAGGGGVTQDKDKYTDKFA